MLNFDQIKLSYEVVKGGIYVMDEEIVSDCLWTLSYIAETDSDEILEYIAQSEILH